MLSNSSLPLSEGQLLLPPSVISLSGSRLTYQYFQVASVALLVYDYLITFPDEVAFIWEKAWTLSSFLFFITRYLPFLDSTFLLAEVFIPNSTSRRCDALAQTVIVCYIIAFIVAGTILTLRTSAIWENRRAFTIALFTFLVICLVPAIYAAEAFVTSLVFGSSPNPSLLPGCIIVGSGFGHFWIVYAAIMVYQTVIFALTVYKASRYYKTLKLANSLLPNTVYRDGILFYAYLFVASLINIVILNVATGQISNVLISIHRILHAIFTGRLILNIRSASVIGLKTISTKTGSTPKASYYYNGAVYSGRPGADTVAQEWV